MLRRRRRDRRTLHSRVHGPLRPQEAREVPLSDPGPGSSREPARRTAAGTAALRAVWTRDPTRRPPREVPGYRPRHLPGALGSVAAGGGSCVWVTTFSLRGI